MREKRVRRRVYEYTNRAQVTNDDQDASNATHTTAVACGLEDISEIVNKKVRLRNLL